MTLIKKQILNKLCYTELVYERINKKIEARLSKKQIQELILKILKKTADKYFIKKGKNYYVTNLENKLRITINSNTFRVITVDRIHLSKSHRGGHFISATAPTLEYPL